MFKSILQKIRTLFNHPRHWRAITACKYGEPLHYHHDGCPACTLCIVEGCTDHISDHTDGWLVCDKHLFHLSELEDPSI